ncbi:Pimeloyl-ACP methyl ester carboxylesterase [Rhizobiales bacterium GAS191]|nr:Pimeloyl-ACP methyl ester carboxylesterase [Rhizobiales bacterium GAS191]
MGGVNSTADIPTLVLLPGLDGTGLLFAPLLRHLPADLPVKVIAYPADPEMGYDELTAYASSQLPDGPLILLGESFSGPIAILLARKFHYRVEGLILAASFITAPMPSFFRFSLALPIAVRLGRSMAHFIVRGFFSAPELTAQNRKDIRTIPTALIISRAREALAVDRTEDFRRITCPVLVLYARYDYLVLPFHVKKIRAIRPDAAIFGFTAPHMLLQTRPAEVAAKIAEFIRR